jgi:hypothetical protein
LRTLLAIAAALVGILLALALTGRRRAIILSESGTAWPVPPSTVLVGSATGATGPFIGPISPDGFQTYPDCYRFPDDTRCRR